METLAEKRTRLPAVLLWLVVLLPIILSILLTRANAVDQRFLDDWELAKYVIKYKEGTLTLHDLGAVYMEHRPVLPRALTIAATILCKGDVRGVNALTILFLLTGFAGIARLLLKHAGLTIRDAWLPLLIAAVTIFTPAQWQTLLWGDCFYAVMPGMFLALALCIAFAKWPWWVRCLVGTLVALLATLSFASGILIWVLPLPVMVLCGEFRNRRAQILFTGLWLAVMAVVFAIYAEVRLMPHDQIEDEKIILSLPGGYDLAYNLRNEVDRQFAYGQGNENTMARNLPYFLEHPLEDLDFVRAFSGVLLMRGAATETRTASIWAGTAMLGGLVVLAFFCWRYRKEREIFRPLFALFCFGAYTPATGLLVAVGRIWAGHVHTALNVRYHAHHPQIIIALVSAAVLILRWRSKDQTEPCTPLGTTVSWVSIGSLLGILGSGWIYGMSMMESWRSARLRNAAAQALCQLFVERNWFVSYVAGNFDLTRQTAAALEKHGLLKAPPLKNAKLSNFVINERVLGPDKAFVNRLWKEGNDWFFEAYASLPRTNRPADGVLLAYRVPGGEWTIWGFTQGDGPPHYLPSAMGKDLWGIEPTSHLWPAEFMCPVDRSPAIISEPPSDAEISFWAIDMGRHHIHRILEPRKAKPDDPGESLQTLAIRRLPKSDSNE